MIIYIHDLESEVPDFEGKIFFWNDNKSNILNSISLPEIVEGSCENYKLRILDFFQYVSYNKINDVEIINKFKREDGFNFWWLTSLGQKFNLSANSNINNVVKLMAFEDEISSINISEIIISTNNIELVKTIQHYCLSKKIKFNSNFCKGKSKSILSWGVNSFYFFIKYIYFFIVNKKYFKSKRLKGKIVFFDIFVHLNFKDGFLNKFSSSYWGSLIDLLDKQKFNISWVHIFFSHDLFPKFSNAKSKTDSFNQNTEMNQFHLFLEEGLSFKIFILSFINYVKYSFVYFHILYKTRFSLRKGEFDYFPLLRDELYESLFGIERIINEIRVLLYKSLLKDSDKQEKGFYIQENQSWEKILNFYWKKYNHGILFGVPHATVRYWDLRYFEVYEKYQLNDLIFPDYILINGNYGYKLISNYLRLPFKLKIVESLRYQYLLNCNPIIESRNILIIGDFQESINYKMLNVVQILLDSGINNYMFYYKQHPAYKIDVSKYNVGIYNKTMLEVWSEFSIVLISDATTCAAEAYSLGVNILQFSDGSRLDFSPVKGLDSVLKFSDNIELLAHLKSIENPSIQNKVIRDYFCLNNELANWKQILMINE